MSYTVAVPPARPRPATVTTASALLYLCAGIQVLSLALSLTTIGSIANAFDESFAGRPEANAVRTGATVAVIVSATISLAFAIATAILGVQVGRGKNPARIVAWVVGGIAILCYGCGLLSNAVSSSLTNSFGPTDPTTVDLQQRIEDAIPAWLNAVSTVLQVLLMLAAIAMVILLASPSSNEFFRRETQIVVPPGWPGTAQPYGGYLPPPPPPPGPDNPPTGTGTWPPQQQ